MSTAWATPAALARLRLYWNAGMSTAEIGAKLGTTKSAIVGKAHRLKFPARPSPIRRNGATRPTAPVPCPVPCPESTLPPLASELVSTPPDAPRPVITAPVRVPVAPPVRFGRVEPCCWVTVVSERGRLPVYCEADSVPGLPYCERHNARAHVATRRRGIAGEPAHLLMGDD